VDALRVARHRGLEGPSAEEAEGLVDEGEVLRRPEVVDLWKWEEGGIRESRDEFVRRPDEVLLAQHDEDGARDLSDVGHCELWRLATHERCQRLRVVAGDARELLEVGEDHVVGVEVPGHRVGHRIARLRAEHVGADACHDDPSEPLRRSSSEREHDPSAHRVPDRVDGLVGEGCEDQLLHRPERLHVVRLRRGAVPEEVWRDHRPPSFLQQVDPARFTPCTLGRRREAVYKEDRGVAHADKSSSAGRIAPLDGVRGVAVLAVLAFHGGVSWIPGGFLGVSAFFTLSGLLIASLLLDEQRQKGRVDLAAFWGRRARRLLPASLVCLLGIVLFGLTQTEPMVRLGLRGDILAALTQVANWRFVFAERSYGDLFVEPSPLLHFWSLAIEEQAYLFLPLVVVATLVVARSRRVLSGVLVALAAVSTTLLVVISSAGQLTQAYYGTHTRVGEILWGAAAAALIGGPWSQPERGTRLLGVLSWPAVIAIGVLWATASPDAPWVYQFALPIHPFLVLVVLLAIARGVGPVGVLSLAPLVALGQISYGVYLYHWPLFLWLDEGRTGLDGPALLAVRVTATVALATLSYRFLEMPIRRASLPRPARLWPVATIPALVVVGAIVVGSTAAPPPSWAAAVPEPPPVDIDEVISPAAPMSAPTSDDDGFVAPVALDRALRVLVVGDSVSRSLGFGLDAWAAENGAFVVWNTGTPGCGIVRSVEVDAAGGPSATPDGCKGWPTLYADRIATFQPDLVVVLVGAWDAGDHRLAEGEPWRSAGDAVFDAALQSDVELAVDVLAEGGATVAWLRYPHFTLEHYPGADPSEEKEDTPLRLDRINAIVAEVAEHEERLEIVDLAGFMEGRPGGQFDLGLRPDGVHFSEDGALEVSRWLGPQLLGLAGYTSPAPGDVASSDGSTWLPD
jgi:peptidoglycan/LPS O-acetylase OafA/YrhL